MTAPSHLLAKRLGNNPLRTLGGTVVTVPRALLFSESSFSCLIRTMTTVTSFAHVFPPILLESLLKSQITGLRVQASKFT